MNSTALSTPPASSPSARSALTPPSPMPRNTASYMRGQIGKLDVAAERAAVLDRDAADRGDVVDLGLREVVGALVGGDAVFVEAAGLGPRLEDRHVMAVARKPVRGGEAGRAGADHGDLLAGRRGALVELLVLLPWRCRWRSAAAGRSAPACPRPPRARRPPRTASRSGRRGRTCRRGCSGRRWSLPSRSDCRSTISRMNSGMSIEVGHAFMHGAS